MEHIRRRKLCLHLRKTKRGKTVIVDDQTDANASSVDHLSRPKREIMIPNQSMCSSDWLVCHPYDDRIHLVHALSDTLAEIFPFLVKLLFLLVQITGNDVEDPNLFYAQRLYDRLKAAKKVSGVLLKEAYYADKNQPWTESAASILYNELFGRGPNGSIMHPQIFEFLKRFGASSRYWRPTLFSQLEGNQDRTSTQCGNYIVSLFKLIPHVKKCVATSTTRKEKRIHLRKLKFFLALERVSKFSDNWQLAYHSGI